MYSQVHNLSGVETTVASDSINIDRVNPPELVGMDNQQDVYDTATLQHKDNDETSPTFTKSREGIIFGAPHHQYERGSTLYYLAEVLSEHRRQLRGGALLHGAAVYLPEQDRGVLVLGEKGAGKTTTVASLCLKASAELIANDQVIIHDNPNEIEIVDGTKVLRVRRTAALQDQKLAEIANFSTNDVGSRPNWDNKVELTSQDTHISNASHPHRVTDIVQVQVDKTLEKTVVRRRVKDIQTTLFLSELLSRHIRGVATPVLTDDGELAGFAPSFDTPETASNRTRLINKMMGLYGLKKIYAPSTSHVIEEILESDE